LFPQSPSALREIACELAAIEASTDLLQSYDMENGKQPLKFSAGDNATGTGIRVVVSERVQRRNEHKV
jgi:hypothetical protein